MPDAWESPDDPFDGHPLYGIPIRFNELVAPRLTRLLQASGAFVQEIRWRADTAWRVIRTGDPDL